jgi:hypothetical protein
MNALTNTNGNAVAVDQDFDPFAEYANSMGGSRIVGKLLKFNKGDWLVGQNGDMMEPGTQLVANMNELLVGWIKWKDKKPAEQLMGRLTDRFIAPKRSALDELDESQWPENDDGDKQDPWQFTNYLLMKVPGVEDQEALFTFTASSRGGIRAVTDLCMDYAKKRRMRAPGEMPIVQIGIDKYKHDKYGWIKNPTFRIVGWVPGTEFEAAMAEDAAQKAADAERRQLDQDIPF